MVNTTVNVHFEAIYPNNLKEYLKTYIAWINRLPKMK